MNDIPSTYQPLEERRQEAMKEGNRSYGMKNTRAYEKEYGEFTGDLDWLLEATIF